VLLAFTITALAACGGSSTPSAPRDHPAAAESATVETGVTILVASNGWHTGIVLARADLAPGAVPETADFPDAAFFEFGWGNAEYFPAPRPTWGDALRAILQPTPAVLHLAGLPAHPRLVFPGAEVIELQVTTAGFMALVAYLDESVARHGTSRAAASAPGLYPFSRFYPATGEFHLFNTCNTWSARALAAAGLPVIAARTMSAEDLMGQLRNHGRSHASTGYAPKNAP